MPEMKDEIKKKNEYFEKIYQEYYVKIYDYIYYRVQNIETAEDLTNDVFLSVYKSLHTYDNRKSFITTWLYAIAYNSLKNYYKNRKEPTVNLDGLVETDNELHFKYENQINQSEMHVVLDCIMEKLPKRNREIIKMRYYRSMTSQEIGEKMNLTPGNVRIILKRSLAAIKKMLDK